MTQSKMDYINARFHELGISRYKLAKETLKEQARHNPWMTLEDAYDAVEAVIRKREVQHALVTALTIDELADKGMLPEPLQSIIADDNPLYGIDESIAMGMAGLFGTIAQTNFGFLDREKTDLAKKLNDEQKSGGHITTMTDDLVSAIIASAEGKVAHSIHLERN